jgi:hypothetical protein
LQAGLAVNIQSFSGFTNALRSLASPGSISAKLSSLSADPRLQATDSTAGPLAQRR